MTKQAFEQDILVHTSNHEITKWVLAKIQDQNLDDIRRAYDDNDFVKSICSTIFRGQEGCRGVKSFATYALKCEAFDIARYLTEKSPQLATTYDFRVTCKDILIKTLNNDLLEVSLTQPHMKAVLSGEIPGILHRFQSRDTEDQIYRIEDGAFFNEENPNASINQYIDFFSTAISRLYSPAIAHMIDRNSNITHEEISELKDNYTFQVYMEQEDLDIEDLYDVMGSSADYTEYVEGFIAFIEGCDLNFWAD